jgi:hypothetical protein
MSPRSSGQHRGPILVHRRIIQEEESQRSISILSINEQGKRLILCFQSISILALSHTIQMPFIGS